MQLDGAAAVAATRFRRPRVEAAPPHAAPRRAAGQAQRPRREETARCYGGESKSPRVTSCFGDDALKVVRQNSTVFEIKLPCAILISCEIHAPYEAENLSDRLAVVFQE